MVIRGLFDVRPIGPHLLVQLLDEDRPPDAPPPRGVAELREQRPQIEQREGLPREVRIGAVVGRQIRLDVSPMQQDELQRALERSRGEARGVPKEIEPPDPGNHSERQLKTARPVDPALGWIGVHPGHQVVDECRGVVLVAGIPIGFPECREVLMPIQLPGQLVLARDVGIQMIDPAPVCQPGPQAGHRIPVPVDRGAKVQTGAAEQVELPLTNTLGPFEHTAFKVRPAAAERRHDLLRLAESREEARRRSRTEPLQQPGGGRCGRAHPFRCQEATEPPIGWDSDLARDTCPLGPHGQPLPPTNTKLVEAPKGASAIAARHPTDLSSH